MNQSEIIKKSQKKARKKYRAKKVSREAYIIASVNKEVYDNYLSI